MGRPLFFQLWFLSSFFLAYSQRSNIGCLPYFYTWCGLSAEFRMLVWTVLHAGRWKYKTQKIAKKSLSVHRPTKLSGYIFAIKACIDKGKNFLNNNISSASPHNTVNVGPLTAEIGWRVWGTPANFNGFRVFASLLHRRRSPEAKQTLHDVWPYSRPVHYIYILGAVAPNEILTGSKFTLVQVLRSPILAALLHSTRAVGVSETLRRDTRNGIKELSLVIFYRGCHLYS